MFKLNWINLQFSVVTFASAMLALFLSMSIDLQQPYWAMLTVYIVSQPLAAAVRSKAIQRLLGTLLGASAAVIMLPLLVNTPALLSLAMALWVGGCLAISLLDRSPRSYIVMLAGYTAAIIGFTSVNQPAEIFTMAVARSEEITLGIICATVMHSLWFPRPMGDTIRSRIQNWLGEADHWALDILLSNDPATMNHDRMKLATAASEIHIMSTHLPFDTSNLREKTIIVHGLHDRILILIPVLSSLADRLCTLRHERSELDPQSSDAIAQITEWINTGAPISETRPLLEKIETMSRLIDHNDWYALNQLGFLSRLHDLVNALGEGHALLNHLHDHQVPLPASLDAKINKTSNRPMHSDLGLALLSGASATLSILIVCTVWIGLGWAEGSASAMGASIVCCLFAAMDDPAPAIKIFGVSLLIAIPLAATYIFFIFPSISSFPMLALTLVPTLLPMGMIILNPQKALPALITLLNFCNSMAIVERINSDFANFLNLNLSMFFSILVAILVTRTLRSMSADASAKRLLRHTWKNLACLAQGQNKEEPMAFASRLIDRLGLLAPRLAASKDENLNGLDALKELRVGMDLVVLQNNLNQLPLPARTAIEHCLQAIGQHYASRSIHNTLHDEPLLSLLDHALSTLVTRFPIECAKSLTALVGLRHTLFPQVPFIPHIVRSNV